MYSYKKCITVKVCTVCHGTPCKYSAVSESTVYNRAIIYKRQIFLTIVSHVISIDHALDEIQVTIYLLQRWSCHCDVRVLLIEGYL